MKPTTSALVSVSHTHTHLSLSLSPPLFPLSLSQLKNLPGILRNPKTRGECKVGRVFILLITISSGSYTSFLDLRGISRVFGGGMGVKEPPGFSWCQASGGTLESKNCQF